jgi:hypothetical protein
MAKRFARIVFEKLSISKMVKSHRLAGGYWMLLGINYDKWLLIRRRLLTSIQVIQPKDVLVVV